MSIIPIVINFNYLTDFQIIYIDLVYNSYLPIQKLAKIFPNKSSFVISPVISPK